VLRLLLQDPAKQWRVVDLAKASGVSLGHVSNIRSALLDREWTKDADAGMFLVRPDFLLDAWRDSYVAPTGESLRFYTPLHGSSFEDAARRALADGAHAQATFASFSAGQWLAPYGRTGTHYFYADKAGLDRLTVDLNLSSAAKGENVVITMPKDKAILADTIEPVPGVICTNLVQTYLDLSIAGERGREAAEHLRLEKLRWST